MSENYKNFKHLLEYFVTHLEYCQTGKSKDNSYRAIFIYNVTICKVCWDICSSKTIFPS